jgi:16S rRNA (uracil1498-N3)-methyltransferase
MSQIFRFFEPLQFTKGSKVTLMDESHHILSKVLRMQSGDSIELLNGEGDIAKSTILSVDKKTTLAQIDNILTISQSKPNIRLMIGSLKGEKLAMVTQKVTELGVGEIGFFNSDHSVAMKSENFLEKTHKTLIEAMRQSGNPFLPKAAVFKKLDDVPLDSSLDHWSVVLDETETIQFPSLLKLHPPASISLFVGPEGGFSEREREYFKKHGCKFIRIAPYVLRADTAAISAVALFRAAFSYDIP